MRTLLAWRALLRQRLVRHITVEGAAPSAPCPSPRHGEASGGPLANRYCARRASFSLRFSLFSVVGKADDLWESFSLRFSLFTFLRHRRKNKVISFRSSLICEQSSQILHAQQRRSDDYQKQRQNLAYIALFAEDYKAENKGHHDIKATEKRYNGNHRTGLRSCLEVKPI